ncbi:MAG TPA: TfoX/Sxy family protein [Steroidobacteraceae bacterium]|nr:TfoX/Sxy family protein [Steroidobacteraceae bacterium]
MATDPGFVEYVCDQIRGAGSITFRRMFGEYALYADGKVVALLCDNQFFLKPTAEGRALLAAPKEGLPYPGARPHLLVDEGLEDSELLSRLVATTALALPAPRPKVARERRKTGTKTRRSQRG